MASSRPSWLHTELCVDRPGLQVSSVSKTQKLDKQTNQQKNFLLLEFQVKVNEVRLYLSLRDVCGMASSTVDTWGGSHLPFVLLLVKTEFCFPLGCGWKPVVSLSLGTEKEGSGV